MKFNKSCLEENVHAEKLYDSKLYSRNENNNTICRKRKETTLLEIISLSKETQNEMIADKLNSKKIISDWNG